MDTSSCAIFLVFMSIARLPYRISTNFHDFHLASPQYHTIPIDLLTSIFIHTIFSLQRSVCFCFDFHGFWQFAFTPLILTIINIEVMYKSTHHYTYSPFYSPVVSLPHRIAAIFYFCQNTHLVNAILALRVNMCTVYVCMGMRNQLSNPNDCWMYALNLY